MPRCNTHNVRLHSFGNWAAGSLEKIKSLKEEGKSLCDSGKLKEGESKLKEAINIINHTKYK